MTHSQLLDYCLGKPGALLCFPFGPDVRVVKVKAPSCAQARIFAQLFALGGAPKITLTCERMAGELFRSAYPDAVTRGWHCPPVQQPFFNTVAVDGGAVPGDVFFAMIDHAYAAALAKLPRDAQKELKALCEFSHVF